MPALPARRRAVLRCGSAATRIGAGGPQRGARGSARREQAALVRWTDGRLPSSRADARRALRLREGRRGPGGDRPLRARDRAGARQPGARAPGPGGRRPARRVRGAGGHRRGRRAVVARRGARACPARSGASTCCARWSGATRELVSLAFDRGARATAAASTRVVAGAPSPAGPEELLALADEILRGVFEGDLARGARPGGRLLPASPRTARSTSRTTPTPPSRSGRTC